MNDSELLELAAKAAGLKVQYSNNCGDYSIGEPYSRGETRWNPLNNDSDAFRLAVNLQLTTSHCCAVSARHNVFITEIGECQYAATRRAIVRAAAEMWRAKTITEAKEQQP